MGGTCGSQVTRAAAAAAAAVVVEVVISIIIVRADKQNENKMQLMMIAMVKTAKCDLTLAKTEIYPITTTLITCSHLPLNTFITASSADVQPKLKLSPFPVPPGTWTIAVCCRPLPTAAAVAECSGWI